MQTRKKCFIFNSNTTSSNCNCNSETFNSCNLSSFAVNNKIRSLDFNVFKTEKTE